MRSCALNKRRVLAKLQSQNIELSAIYFRYSSVRVAILSIKLMGNMSFLLTLSNDSTVHLANGI